MPLPNSADAERLFSELGCIFAVEKTHSKDSTFAHKVVIAADLRTTDRLGREARGELGVPNRDQKRFVGSGSVLQRLRSIDDDSYLNDSSESEFTAEIQHGEGKDAILAALTTRIIERRLRGGWRVVEDIVGEDNSFTVNELLEDTTCEPLDGSKLRATEAAVADFSAILEHLE